MAITFDPNAKKAQLNTWATYIPTRSTKPKFSTHRTGAHAKSALQSSVGVIYEHVDGEWVERFRRDEPDSETGRFVCCKCGAPHCYRRVPGSTWKSEKVEGGEYLHGYWDAGDSFVYNYYCGSGRKCKKEA